MIFIRIFNIHRLVRYYRNFLIGLYIMTIIWLEYFVYSTNTVTWSSLQCRNEQKCSRILFIADPQLIGYNNEENYLQPFSIWDSDWYISKTFAYAFKFARPDILVFLGDLMDEGSIATDEEFKDYLRRLFGIFVRPEQYQRIRHVWLPGDNDLGGERFEPVNKHSVERFDHAFQQPDIISLGNVDFYKITYITSRVPKIPDKKDFFDTKRITVGLSHLPLLYMPSVFNDKVLAKLQPQLIFTAHIHRAMVVSTNALTRDDRHVTRISSNDTGVYEYQLGIADLYEFLIPTCSYRMGTEDIGYGYAIIEDGFVRFTVLWSPQRFPQLKLYGYMLGLSAPYLIVFCILKLLTMGRKTKFYR